MFDKDIAERKQFAASLINSNDREIFNGEDDTEVAESTEQTTVPKVSKEIYSEENAKDKDVEPSWELKQQQQNISHSSPNKSFVRFNSRFRGEQFTRNKGIMLKRDVSYLMDDDKQKCKRRRFDQIEEKDPYPVLKNNQNVHFDQITQSVKSTIDQQSPFYLPPLENYELEETIKEKKSTIESTASLTVNDISAMELEKTDIDLRQLPFRFPIAVAKEIDASLYSNPPINYLLTPIEVFKFDYSNILPTMGIDDPRLKNSIAAARNPFIIQNNTTATTATPVRPVALKKKRTSDPRKSQQDVSICATTVCAPIVQTPSTHA